MCEPRDYPFKNRLGSGCIVRYVRLRLGGNLAGEKWGEDTQELQDAHSFAACEGLVAIASLAVCCCLWRPKKKAIASFHALFGQESAKVRMYVSQFHIETGALVCWFCFSYFASSIDLMLWSLISLLVSRLGPFISVFPLCADTKWYKMHQFAVSASEVF